VGAWCFIAVLFLTALYLTPSAHQTDQLYQTAASTVHIEVVDGG
jgi:hypothetical protein